MAVRAQERTMPSVVGRRFERSVADVPAMVALWDVGANDVDPAAVGARSSRRRHWRCPVAEDHRWSASPSSIDKSLEKGFTGCPACAGRQLSVTNSFASRHPAGVRLWHPTRNGNLTPAAVVAGSPHMVWWRCAEGPDHEWQCAPLVMSRYDFAAGKTGCPFCAGKRASVTNSIAAHPQLSAEYHPTKNDVPATEVVAGTAKKVWWRCVEDPTHEWQATGANRLAGRGCARCKQHLRSILEVCLAFELQQFFPDLDLRRDKVEIDGVVRHVDLLLPGAGVVVEVDGRYRHAGEVELDRDRRKTAALTAAGYRVLRVREEPLTPVGDHDVVVPSDPTVKQTTDAVLDRLRELGWIELPNVDDYLTDPEPRRAEEALAWLRRERPGKVVRLPGPRDVHAGGAVGDPDGVSPGLRRA